MAGRRSWQGPFLIFSGRSWTEKLLGLRERPGVHKPNFLRLKHDCVVIPAGAFTQETSILDDAASTMAGHRAGKSPLRYGRFLLCPCDASDRILEPTALKV